MGFPLWLIASLLLHAWFVRELVTADHTETPSETSTTSLWIESAQPEPEPEPEPKPEPAPPIPTRKPRTHAPSPIRAAAESDGTLDLAASQGSASSQDAQDAQPAGASVPTPDPRPLRERAPSPPQLSLWLDLLQLQRMSLVRPVTAFLVVVPGYRDMLLGTNLRPFSDLQRLRIRIDRTTASTLTLAGVHNGGESALRTAAERVAAMRQERPIWRGDAELRATAWVDGSGVARGLAVHAGAFVIAPRASMPSLLGERDPSARVAELSHLRERVLLLATIEDAGQYVSDLQGCGLAALRISLATFEGSYRLALRASYESDVRAATAAECSTLHASETSRQLSAWLAQAKPAPGEYVNKLNIGVTQDEIERLLDELGWGIRRAERR